MLRATWTSHRLFSGFLNGQQTRKSDYTHCAEIITLFLTTSAYLLATLREIPCGLVLPRDQFWIHLKFGSQVNVRRGRDGVRRGLAYSRLCSGGERTGV